MQDASKMRKIRAAAEKKQKDTKHFFIFAILVIFIFFLIFIYLNFFKIKTIDMTGEEKSAYSEKELLEACGVKKGDNLISLSSSKVEEKLLESYPYIKSVTVTKKLPDTLKLELEFYPPSVAVVLGGDVFFVSTDGNVLGSIPDEDSALVTSCEVSLPFVTECKAGEKIKFEDEENFEIFKQVMEALEKHGILKLMTYIDLQDKFSVKGIAEGKLRVIFGSYEDFEQKALRLAEAFEKTGPSVIIDLQHTEIDVSSGDAVAR